MMNTTESLCSDLYYKYAHELYAYGRSLEMEEVFLEDAIHDIYLYLLENQNLLTEIKNLKFYFFRCLKNRLISSKRHNYSFEPIDGISEYEFTMHVTSIDMIIEEEEKNAVIHQVDVLLKCLTSHQKEAIYLKFQQNLTYEEVGELLEITPKAARNLVYRSIDKIREINPSLMIFLLPKFLFMQF